MTPQGETLQKLGSAGYIVGALLLVTASLLLPRGSDLSNVQEMQKSFTDQAVLLQVCALLYAFGYWAVMIGTQSLYRSITMAGADWARLGFYFAVVATALWTIGFSIDISYAAALSNWVAAPPAGKAVAYSIVAVLSPLGFGRGLFPLSVIVNGLAFTCLGVGMVRSENYPGWLGWLGLILGVSGMLLGSAQTFTGRERSLTLFVALEAVTILWFMAVGVWMARRAWSLRTGGQGKEMAPHHGGQATTTETT
jgi:hypothetical protein